MPTKTLMTADELLKMPVDGYRYELNEGELKKMSPGGGKHGAAIGKFTGYLAFHVYENDLGTVCGAETGYKVKTNPDSVIAPDVSFISKERIPESEIPDGYLTIIPELVVEVLSPNDSKKEVAAKITAWFDFGVSVVILINPRKQIVEIYRSLINVTNLDENAILDLSDIIVGFSYPVSKFFPKKSN